MFHFTKSASLRRAKGPLIHVAMILAAVAAFASRADDAAGAGATSGQQLAAQAKVNAKIFSAADDPYPDHHVSFGGSVTGIPDVTYQILPRYRPMKLDLYLPPPSFRGPRPTIIYIHGGGWISGGFRLSGAFDNWPTVLASIAKRGYVVASVSYRFSGEAPAPAAIQDVKAAIRWLRANSGKYNVDKARMMAWGGSAGGQLAALAATSCGSTMLDPASLLPATHNANVEQATTGASPTAVESDCLSGAVIWYGIFNFASKPLHDPDFAYLGCKNASCTPEQMALSSPITYVSENTPPLLMIAGSDDQTVPPSQSTEFYKALQARHLRSELMIIPGVDHSFIGKTGKATQEASRAALARTVDFFDSIIGDHVKP